MEKTIKTREHIKDIKLLDKSVIATQRMKDTLVQTKEKAEHGYSAEEHSPNEYATERVYAGADRTAKGAVRVFDEQGRKAVRTTKENIGILREKVKEKKKQADIVSPQSETYTDTHMASAGADPKGYPPKQNMQSASAVTSPAGLPESERAFSLASRQRKQVPIKTLQRGKKTIKETSKSIKQVVKGPARTTVKTVKTAEQTAHATIKTTEQAAKTAAKSAKATVRASKKAAQVARVTARKAATAAKAAAKATVSAVKGILLATKALVTALIAGGWIAVLIILIMVLFGSAIALFGGGSSNTATPVSAEVQAYEPLIRQYATQHGIPEYVELIKAVMMQESGGRGLDPMQASEGAFNTRYPRQPNGITDPDYSVSCGVQELKSVLVQAKVENPIDMEHIKLALQGYNFGNGYISWAVNKDGGYTSANAVEFSDMMAQRLGWGNYGDKQYVPHVLRYYPFGRNPVGTGNQAMVEVALSQLGNVGGQPYWSWYGFSGRVEWCACYVSWVANECGYIESGVIPKFAGCVQGSNWFKERGQWQDRNYTPEPGSIIFFDWGNDGETDHVGIVERVENGTVYTVEGNSGDACRQRSYSIGSSVIYGYGTPAY